MTSSNLSFNVALITGGAGGIGLEIAKWLQGQGKKVIIAGRTTSKLEEASSKQLKGCPYYTLDTGVIGSIPDFITRVTTEHPDLDCVINNAGVQRPLSITDGSFDLAKADQEIDINIRGPMHLTIGLLPHLQTKADALIINVSSVLGFVPFSVINPVYTGTKAWLHFWSMTLRTQLTQAAKSRGKNEVKVIEIVPPMVATDLHREREDPDDNKKHKASHTLTLEEFMEQVGQQWKEGRNVLAPGMAKDVTGRWQKEFGEQYDKMTGGGK